MPGIESGETVWRVRVKDPAAFDKFRVKELVKGVKMTYGRIKGTNRWEVENYMFEKTMFKTKDQVRSWLDKHLKSQIKTLLDYRAWNEYRRQCVMAYVQISQISQ